MGRIKSLNNVGKYILRTDNTPNEKGEFRIYIQYTLDRKVAKSATDVWVKEKDWNEKLQQVRASHPLHSRLNGMLAKFKRDIDEQLLDYQSKNKRITIDTLRAIVKGTFNEDAEKFVDFVELAKEDLDTQHRLGKIGVSVRDNGYCGLRIFRLFLLSEIGESQIDCKDVNEDLIDRYILWRKETRGNTNETINKTLTPLMKAAKVAARRKLMDTEIADAIAVKYLAPTKQNLDDDGDKEIHYLTEEQLKQFVALYDTVKYPRTKDFMDMFLFSIHTCGLRVSDIITLQWSNVDFEGRKIRKVLVKGTKSHELPLNDKAVEILKKWQGRHDRFVFGFLPNDFDLNNEDEVKRMRINKNRALMQSLITLGEKMGLDFRLTFHVARHTFAVLALNKGIDIHKVSSLMAHSSVFVTEQRYAKFLPETLQQEIESKLNFDF